MLCDLSEVLISGPEKKKALLIAVEHNIVPGFPRLIHAHRDANELQCLLIETYGYPKENIVLMKDRESHPKDLWPTKKNIKKQIQLFVKGVSSGDHLFFYYSGHGRQVTCYHHTESDGMDEEIYSCNGKEIMDNDLKRWLVNPLPPGCRLFALWDSCHSLTILDLDHYKCNEPKGAKRVQHRRESSPRSMFWQVLSKRFQRKVPRSASTIALHELRGRPVTRASVSITAVSAGGSPPLSSKWIPFFEDVRRVLSPPSWFPCDGNCQSQTETDEKRAHVISLSACKDSEVAVDDSQNGTVTKFFIDHLREKPKSTLGELLLAIRERVDIITAARQGVEPRVISRRTTFASASGSLIRDDWVPGHQVVRRNTEFNISPQQEFLALVQQSVNREEVESRFSQKPSYSSHYRLNLDELVDL